MNVEIVIGVSGYHDPPQPEIDGTWSVFMRVSGARYGIDLARDKNKEIAIEKARLILNDALMELHTETPHSWKG